MIDLRSVKAAARALVPSSPEKAVFAAASAALVAAGATRKKRVEQVVKPLVMGSIAVGIWRTRERRDAVDNALLGAAAIASLAGDVLMIEEEFADGPEAAASWIKRGASAFAVNHLATVALATRHGARPGMAELLPRAVGVAEGAALLGAKRRELLVPLLVYSKLLATMSTVMASPQLTEGVGDDDPRRALELGGVLFLASDATILHRQAFLEKETPSGAAAEGWVLASYAAAQALIFSGLESLAAARAG
jgi:hypothetical protein